MKKLCILVGIVLITLSTFAQNPFGGNYQRPMLAPQPFYMDGRAYSSQQEYLYLANQERMAQRQQHDYPYPAPYQYLQYPQYPQQQYPQQYQQQYQQYPQLYMNQGRWIDGVFCFMIQVMVQGRMMQQYQPFSTFQGPFYMDGIRYSSYQEYAYYRPYYGR